MSGLTVPASVDAHLTWDYDPRLPNVRSLYERAKHAQWNAATDVDWSVDVAFGSPLPDDSSFAQSSFEASPLARYGRPMWDTFRWEFQSWMVSQFLHGEQGALLSAARLVEVVPEIDAKYCAASQVADEARHIEVFSQYLRAKVPVPYPVSPPLSALLSDALADRRWDVTALGMQIMVEALALAAFRLANTTFHDELIKQITQLVARDEARHVSFGVLSLDGLYGQMTAAERGEREEFTLEAAHLMSRRFQLEEIWDRIGIDQRRGIAYATTDTLMIQYRQAIFAKVVSALSRIGLMTDRVRDGFARLNLLGPAAGRVALPAAKVAN